jgi:hypothetical protein
MVQKGIVEHLIPPLRSGTHAGKRLAALASGNLSLIEENRAEIIREGAVEPLVDVLSGTVDEPKECAAYTLGNLSTSHSKLAEIARSGAIRVLVALAGVGTKDKKRYSVAALQRLADNASTAQLLKKEFCHCSSVCSTTDQQNESDVQRVPWQLFRPKAKPTKPRSNAKVPSHL